MTRGMVNLAALVLAFLAFLWSANLVREDQARRECILAGSQMQDYSWGGHYRCVVRYWESGQEKYWVVKEK